MIPLLFVTLSSAALALEGQPGLWLPGSTRLGQADGRFGAGVVWAEGGGESVMLKGIVGASSRVAFNAEGFLGGAPGYPDVGLGVRVRVIEESNASLAPYLQVDFHDSATHSYAGLAGAIAADTFTFDASLTLLGAQTDNGRGSLVGPPDALRWLEAGLTWHPAPSQELRLGAISRDRFQMALSYRWLGSWWYVEPDLQYWPHDLDARLHAGVRF